MFKTENDVVEFRGHGEGLLLIINKEVCFAELSKLIEEKISSAESFYKGAKIASIDSKFISPFCKSQLIKLLKKYDINYVGIDEYEYINYINDKNNIKSYALQKIVRTEYIFELNEKENIDYNGDLIIFADINEDVEVKTSLNITIFGDIKSGAKVYAGGSVFCSGDIKGFVNAGVYGNETACIISKTINAQKIGITEHFLYNVVSRMDTNNENPEILILENSQLILSTKKKLIYIKNPKSLKDTSFGAFDFNEGDFIVEKNNDKKTKKSTKKKKSFFSFFKK